MVYAPAQIFIQCWLITQSLWLYYNKFIGILDAAVSWCQKEILEMAHSWLVSLNVTYIKLKI